MKQVFKGGMTKFDEISHFKVTKVCRFVGVKSTEIFSNVCGQHRKHELCT